MDSYKQIQEFLRAAEDAMRPYDRILDSVEIDRLTARQLEWQRSIDALATPLLDPQMSLRATEPIDEALTSLRSAFEGPTGLDVLTELAGSISENARMTATFAEALKVPAVTACYEQLRAWVGRIEDETAIARAILQPTPQWQEEILRPVVQYSAFLRETSELLTKAADVPTARALEGSLLLAHNIMALQAHVAVPAQFITDDSGTEEPFDQDGAILPFVQREELLAARAELKSISVAELESHSPATRTARLAVVLTDLVCQINELRKTKGRDEIFRPTTMLLRVIRDLPLTVARERDSFGKFVDQMYFVLYEAAGKDRLRYLVAEGGELSKEECSIVWTIKHLRNTWLRHDADHGDAHDIRRKWTELDADLRALGLERLPVTEHEFRRAQEAIVNTAIQMLTAIRDRIS